MTVPFPAGEQRPRWRVFGLVAVVPALIGAAWIVAAFPSASPWQAPFRLALAVVVCVLLPGYLLSRALGWFKNAEGIHQRLPLAFGVGYTAIALLYSASVALHLSLTEAWAWLSLAVIALALVPAKQVEWPTLGGGGVSAAFLFAVMVIGGLGWVIEAPIDGEETVEIISVRKISENPYLSLDGLMPEPRAVPTYVIMPAYFFEALVAKAAGLPVIAAYVKLRAFYAVLALLTFAALATRLFPRYPLEMAGAMVIGVLALLVVNPEPWSWPASLFPLVRRGSLTAGVIAPVFMLAMLVYVTRPPTSTPARAEWAVPGLLLISLLTTHAMEIIYAGFVVLAVAACRFLIPKSGFSLGRVISFTISTAVAAVLFRAIHSRLVTHVYAFDQPAASRALDGLKAELAQGFTSLLGISEAGRYLVSVSGEVLPYPAVGILMIPLLVKFERVGGTVLWLAALVPLTVYSSSKLFALLQLATSSEILFVFSYFALLGTMAFLAVGFILVNLAVARAQPVVARCGPLTGAILLAAGAGVAGGMVVAPVVSMIAAVLIAVPLALPWALAIAGLLAFPMGGSVLTLTASSRHKGDRSWRLVVPQVRGWHPAPHATLAFAALMLGLALGMAQFGPRAEGATRRSVIGALADQAKAPSVLDWEAYYPLLQASARPPIDLPAAVVADLRRLLPPLQTLIADPAHSFSLPVVLNQHIVNPGHRISTSLAYFDRYTVDRNDGKGRHHPIFNGADTLTAGERRFLEEYQVQYILVNPTYEAVLRRKLAEPGRFELLYERDGFLLYRTLLSTPTSVAR